MQFSVKRLSTVTLFWLLSLYISIAQSTKPVLDIRATDISCTGKTDGMVRIQYLAGALPIKYTWQVADTGAAGQGILTTDSRVIEIRSLAAGIYRFEFTNSDTAKVQRIVNILEPSPLQVNIQRLSNFNGYALACANGKNGRALALARGGTPAYAYAWSNGETTAVAERLTKGFHEVTISDVRGCARTLNVTLEAPPPLLTTLTSTTEKCAGDRQGSIELSAITGGVAPYQISFQDGPFDTETVWKNLPPTTYFLRIRDDNGCVRNEAVVLPAGQQIQFSAGADTAVYLGDTLRLGRFVGTSYQQLLVEPAEGAQVLNDKTLLLFPNSTRQYVLTAVDTNGCRGSDLLLVQLRRDRSVYAPNVLAPNAPNPENQVFRLYDPGNVQRIESLHIIDRAGRVWHVAKDVDPAAAAATWDGRATNGQPAPVGVYTWLAWLRFGDGRHLPLNGEVTLIR